MLPTKASQDRSTLLALEESDSDESLCLLFLILGDLGEPRPRPRDIFEAKTSNLCNDFLPSFEAGRRELKMTLLSFS